MCLLSTSDGSWSLLVQTLQVNFGDTQLGHWACNWKQNRLATGYLLEHFKMAVLKAKKRIPVTSAQKELWRKQFSSCTQGKFTREVEIIVRSYLMWPLQSEWKKTLWTSRPRAWCEAPFAGHLLGQELGVKPPSLVTSSDRDLTWISSLVIFSTRNLMQDLSSAMTVEKFSATIALCLGTVRVL